MCTKLRNYSESVQCTVSMLLSKNSLYSVRSSVLSLVTNCSENLDRGFRPLSIGFSRGPTPSAPRDFGILLEMHTRVSAKLYSPSVDRFSGVRVCDRRTDGRMYTNSDIGTYQLVMMIPVQWCSTKTSHQIG